MKNHDNKSECGCSGRCQSNDGEDCLERADKAGFKTILVAVDESQQAFWATQTAGEIAGRYNSKLVLLHVIKNLLPSPELVETAGERRREAMALADLMFENVRSALSSDAKPSRIICEGHAAERIVAAADELNCDLIVIGTHGRSRLTQFFLGGTAEMVVRRACCPVLTVSHKPKNRPVVSESDVSEMLSPQEN